MPTQVLTPLFYRRLDLTLEVRLRIASIALLFSKHGTVTRLAGKYNVSRAFIYKMRETLLGHGKEHFGFSLQEPVQN